jgi:hypothetical protein
MRLSGWPKSALMKGVAVRAEYIKSVTHVEVMP